MATSVSFYPGNPYNVYNPGNLQGNPSDGSGKIYLNSATVTWVLKDARSGSTIATGTLDYITGSDGLYEGLMTADDTALCTAGLWYNLFVSAVQGLFFRNWPAIQMKALSLSVSP